MMFRDYYCSQFHQAMAKSCWAVARMRSHLSLGPICSLLKMSTSQIQDWGKCSQLMCAVVAFIRFCNNSSLGLPTTGLKSLHTPKDNFDNNGSYQMGMDPLKLYGFSPADLGKVYCIFSHLTIFYSSSAVLIQSFLSTFSFYPPKYDYCRQSSIYWNLLVAIAKEKGEQQYIVVHGHSMVGGKEEEDT